MSWKYKTFWNDKDSISLTSYIGEDIERIVVPAFYDYFRVREVLPTAFSRCKNLKEIVVEDGVEFFWLDALNGIDKLVSVELSSRTQVVGGAGCSTAIIKRR